MKNLRKWINRAFKHYPRKEWTVVMGAQYEPQTFGQPVERMLINNLL